MNSTLNEKVRLQPKSILSDITASIVVFLVALPLCLGVALASGAPAFSGLLAGIIGGIVVGTLSGSNTSVSGPAAGLTAVVAMQITTLGSFEVFLFAVFLAGLIQIVLGICRMGFISAFFPVAVINGLLAAIGIILILKQIPHLLGRDTDPIGDLSFLQIDQENTFSELLHILENFEPGAALIGGLSLLLLVIWNRTKLLKKSPVPPSLIVVIFGVVASQILSTFGEPWLIGETHLVNVPIPKDLPDFFNFLRFPDFSQWNNTLVYKAAFTIAIIASLETLLNVEAVDKLDPLQRATPTSRELFAQGIGNSLAGLLGAIPVTAVIVRGSVNINAGARSKLSTILHGGLILLSIMFLPKILNLIPLSCLAAILIMTGAKLASFILLKEMWKDGWTQFLPFMITLIAIVFTDLLVGVIIGLMVSLSFILWSNVRRPVRRVIENHPGGEIVHIQLANQVSFLNKAALDRVLTEIPNGGQVLFDATETDYMDPDILTMIKDYRNIIAPARDVTVSLIGFRDDYQLQDQILFIDFTSRDIRDQLTPEGALQILREGHDRFRTGKRMYRDLGRQAMATSTGQHPIAAVLSCIDSRAPAEILFDTGLGDIFSVRIAGNVARYKVLGSLEYAVAVAGAKLIVVMGHTRCGAVNAALKFRGDDQSILDATKCEHLAGILHDIQLSITPEAAQKLQEMKPDDVEAFDELADEVSARHVLKMIENIMTESNTIKQLVEAGTIFIVGAIYDITTKQINFLTELPPEKDKK